MPQPLSNPRFNVHSFNFSQAISKCSRFEYFFLGHRVRRSVWESKLLAPRFCFQGRLFSPRQKVLASVLHTK